MICLSTLFQLESQHHVLLFTSLPISSVPLTFWLIGWIKSVSFALENFSDPCPFSPLTLTQATDLEDLPFAVCMRDVSFLA